MKLLVIIILLTLIIIEACAELLLTKATHNNNNRSIFLLLGIICYILIAIMFYFMMKQQRELAIVNTVWQGANIFIISVFSVIFLKERLLKIQIVGIILTIIGIILVNFKSSDSDNKYLNKQS